MNYFNKKNLVILSIVVLLIINVAAISTIIYLSYRKPPLPPLERIPEVRTPAIKESLQFTDEQREVYSKLDLQYKENTQQLFAKLHQCRLQMMDEFSKPKPDSSILYELAEETGAMHRELKKLTINHLLDIKGFCSERQFKYLERRFRSRIMDDEPRRRFHHGRKGKHSNSKGSKQRKER